MRRIRMLPQMDDHGRGMWAIKVWFSISNILLLLFGASCLAIGIFVVAGFVDDSWPQSLRDALRQTYAGTVGQFVMIVGGVCLAFGLFGLLSTWRCKNFLGLTFYTTLLFLMAAGQIALGLYAVLDGSIEDLPIVGTDLSEELRGALTDDYCTPLYSDENPQQTLYAESFECEVVERGDFSSDDAASLACGEYQNGCYVLISSAISDNMLYVGIALFGMGLLELTGFWTGALVAQHNRRLANVVPYEDTPSHHGHHHSHGQKKHYGYSNNNSYGHSYANSHQHRY